MSFMKSKYSRSTFGIIVGNRDVFPDHLVKEGRKEILNLMNELEYEYIILDEEDTPLGAVETYSDSKKCAELFKKNSDKISGVIICLSNFGDEKGIATTLRLANLNIPILIQASSDKVDEMSREFRRDSFCGKISVCSVLYQYGIPFTLTKTHTCPIQSEDFKSDIFKFDRICQIVKKLKNARFGQIGTRPNAFETVRYSEKILEINGITIEPIDLSEIFGK
ncbi:MAG: fucose isomerase, partial [Promethearchaeota archaeon]